MKEENTVETVRPGSLRAWILAARPKTLSAALAPVGVASALAWHDGHFRLVVCLLCVLFATAMQVAANLINDVMDFRRGTDGEDRLGPDRACAQGWLSVRQCWWGVGITLALAALVGMTLLMASGAWIDWSQDGMQVDWQNVGMLAAVGLACGLFAFLYTSLLSYIGLGDLLVYVFFGFVPVVGTYYVQALTATPAVWWMGAAVGLVIDTLLLLNNYRDRDTDRRCGKRTLVAVLGESFGSVSYFLHGFLGLGCALLALFLSGALGWSALVYVLYAAFHVRTWRTMTRIRQGRALNRVLGMTSQGILLFALLTMLAVLL